MNPTAYDARIRDMVDRLGWAVQYVGGDDATPFAYSIGLTKRKLPEVLLIAPVDPDTTYAIINGIAQAFIANAETAQPGILHEILEVPIELRLVTNVEQFYGTYALTARRWNEHEQLTPIAPLQIILPDEAGRFPDNAAFDWFLPPLI